MFGASLPGVDSAGVSRVRPPTAHAALMRTHCGLGFRVEGFRAPFRV